MIFATTFSKGRPSFSYIAMKKNGSMIVTIRMAAILEPIGFLMNRYNGIPTTAASEKKINCRFVRFNATFVLTLVRSFGTGTYAMVCAPFLPANGH